MKKTVLLMLLCLTLLLAVGCSTSTPVDTDDVTDNISDSTQSGALWVGEGLEITETVIKSTDTLDELTAFYANESFPERFVLDTKLTMTKYSCLRFIIEAKYNDSGELTSGYAVTVDARVGKFYLTSFYEGTQTKLTESSFTKTSDGIYYMSVTRNRNTFEASIYKDEEKTQYLGYASVLARELSGSTVAFGLCGDTVISDINIGEFKKDETLKYYQNPIHEQMADPSIYYEDGVYYLFSTGDFFECYTTTDLIN